MKKARKNSRAVLAAGYILVALSIIGVIGHLLLRDQYSSEINMIVIVGDAFLAAIGAVAVLIGKSLGEIEDRISRIENP